MQENSKCWRCGGSKIEILYYFDEDSYIARHNYTVGCNAFIGCLNINCSRDGIGAAWYDYIEDINKFTAKYDIVKNKNSQQTPGV
jgi:hypothetical protein